MNMRKRAGFLSLNRISELIWDIESRSSGLERQPLWGRGRVWTRARGVTPATGPTNIQRSHARPVVRFLQLLLMKRIFFRVGQVNRSKHHPLRRGHGPQALKEVSYTPLGGPQRAKRQRSATYKVMAPVRLALSCCILRNYHTAGDGD